MQEVPCAHCGTDVPAALATKGDLIDNMSRESYCSPECRDEAERVPWAGKTITRTERQEIFDGMADPFAA